MAVIYVYSKKDCPLCDTAIALLTSKNKVFKVKKLDEDYLIDDLIKLVSPVPVRSFPQIVVDDFGEIEYIGGLTGLADYLRKNI